MVGSTLVSPSFSGDWSSVSAVVDFDPDLDGVLTARFVDDKSGAVFCEAHEPFTYAAGRGRLGLYCGWFRGSLRLELIEGAGSVMVDFVRLDFVSAAPTPVPSPTPTLVPTLVPPTATVVPAAMVAAAPYYPAGGSYVVRSTPAPTATPAACSVFVSVYSGAGEVYGEAVDVEFLSDRTLSYSISGYAAAVVRLRSSIRDRSQQVGGAALYSVSGGSV